MSEFKRTKWIKMSLFLMLLLQFKEITGEDSFFTIRDGDYVTLPCGDRIKNQDKCNGTTWIFSDRQTSPGLELINLGQIGERVTSKADRLSLTEKCSLVIKKVTVEDVGLYTCRQFDTSGKQQGPSALSHLSVVNINEDKANNRLTCSVLIYGHCRHTVQWLYEGNDFTDLETSQETCSAAVTLKTPHPYQKESFQCKVTDENSGNLLLCNFASQSSFEEQTQTTTAAELKTTASPTLNSAAEEARSDCSALNYLMLAMRVAELVLITVLTVLLFRARGNQRPHDSVSHSVRGRTVKRSGPAASQVHSDEDEDDGRVNYENFGEPCVSVRLH